MMKVLPMSQAKVERSITVNTDMSWHVHVAGKLVSTNKVLKEFPSRVSDVKCLQHMMQCVERAHLCPGNPQPEFVEVVNKRASGNKAAYVDSEVEVIDVDGQMYGRTVRRSDCELLCTPSSSHPKRCKNCSQYRSHLRVTKSRNQVKDTSARTAHDSHCNIRYLSKDENLERHKSVQKQKIALKEKVKRLEMEKKARKLIESEGVRLSMEDAADVQAVMEENSDKVDGHFDKDLFQHILWEQQKKYSGLKDKRQMRWHPLVIRFALSLRYASSTAYRTVTSSGLLSLPSERTLRDYTHWCAVQNGVHFPFIEKARKVMVQEGLSTEDKQFALIMDEMKIKQGLVYRKHTGELVGFCDLGTVNQELEELANESNHNPTPKLAEQMLTFMIRPIFRPSLSFMIASYASLCLSGEKLYAPVWEVVEALEFSGLPVLSLTSDGAAPNRRFYKLCRIKDKTHKTPNPFADRDLYFFCDPPHLLKTARNCLSNSGAHSNTRNLMVSILRFSHYRFTLVGFKYN